MTESIVNALVQLFAIIESVKEDLEVVDSGNVIVKPYLSKTLNQELTNEYLRLFYDYLAFYRDANTDPAGDHELGIDTTSIIQVAKICNQLNKELLYKERVIVLLQLLELINADQKVTPKENEFINLVALNFNLNQKELKSIKSFILDPEAREVDPDHGLVIDNKIVEWPEEIVALMNKNSKRVEGSTKFYHLYIKNLFGTIRVLYIESVHTYVFRYDGPLNLYLEGNRIAAGKFYILKPGSIIKGPNIRSIYESEITQQFIQERNKTKVVLSGNNLEYRFFDGYPGIQAFNFNEESGQLVGIMGGSGVGKSTLINLLNGNLRPTSGYVHLNGFSVSEASESGIIGYVPQDDLLFEELTVYQNLYFNAQLCFGNFSETQIEEAVNKILNDLDLYEIRNLKVGDPLNKFISGGQRKRLNIALELMREPAVLFVDEPTSGLSSMDSEKVMWLLKDLARRGKLVIAIIHQPSSDIFKLLDKLWILDKGGYPIYTGNPIDAVVYFKTMSTQVNAAESECTRCGNVIPEQILQIIEAKEIDDYGRVTNKRRVKPESWYGKYRVNIESQLKRLKYRQDLPDTNFQVPGLSRQLEIFSKRNLLAKRSNTQYILINLLEAPILAFILGYFSKYAPHGTYLFSESKNLPVYLFMAVVVALFMGMSVSAEEIYRDRKIVERESFLNLSRFSYLNSKILYLFLLSAIQTLSFVLVGNLVLEIQGMTFYFWLILFSTSCLANLIGLNVSASLNSIITIYIVIPFILVPQLLLGGAMIKFDELHNGISKQIYVPVVGDIMASRWAYEAMVVGQFKHNRYNQHFFEVDKQMSEASFQRSYLIPYLQNMAENITDDASHPEKHLADLQLIRFELNQLASRHGVELFKRLDDLDTGTFDQKTGQSLLDYLSSLQNYYQEKYQEAAREKDQIYAGLINESDREQVVALKRDHLNQSLLDMVENRDDLSKMVRIQNRIVQKKDPIYLEPYEQNGRAHFFAPIKTIGSVKIDTMWFDIAVLWLISVILYLMLLHNTLKRTIRFFTKTRRRLTALIVGGVRKNFDL